MITYYGAYFSIENVHYQLYGTNSASLDIAYGRPLLRANVTDQLDRVYDPHHPCTDKQKCHLNFTLTIIGLGILTAGLSYIASIFYLYLHYEAEQRYWDLLTIVKDELTSDHKHLPVDGSAE